VTGLDKEHQAGVRMKVDESRCDDLTGRIDHACSFELVPGSHNVELIAADGHVGRDWGCTGAIDDGSAADQDVDGCHRGQA
jgi:hypothetical protein